MSVGIIDGIANALSLSNIGFAFAGAFLGTLVGVLPGLGPASAMAILLPAALYLPAEGSIIVMAGIYYGSMYGGSTTAILMNIPGEVASTITAQDGYAMTQKGRAGEALAISAIGSFLAGIGGAAAIGFIGPRIADIAIAFGPPEYFGLALFSMTALVSFAGKSIITGLGLGVFGMFLAAAGTDPLTGAQRLTFGYQELTKGFDIVPVLVGLFGIAEVLTGIGEKVDKIYAGRLGSWWSMIPRGRELVIGLVASVRGSVVGFLLGLLPGMLPALSSYLAYDVERYFSRRSDQFGKGVIEGVAAPEAANNACAMAGFIPLLSLGVPTSPPLAILLGTLLLNGVTPGPLLFEQQPLLSWTVIGSMLVANAALLILNLPLVGVWARISRIPYSVLAPIVLAVCLIGAYAPRNTMFDVWVAIVFGVVGYGFRRAGLPLAPLVLGFLIGPLFEQSLRQSMAMSDGSPLIFIQQPIALGFLLLAAAVAVLITLLKTRSRAVRTLITEGANEA
ncbi:tripartite tricarboxylate transporter permease [Aquabacter cavernae]|uniref:tripartite tricarboxylate transporter permease n=1 Tax=Aquabacter cavernae TaxID=2496029 RepID=UPI000F8C6583|nr:tripartite tricarboxylate transporter permease [Aquabacter cavernae]